MQDMDRSQMKEVLLSTRDKILTEAIERGLGTVDRDELLNTGQHGENLWIVEPEAIVELTAPPQRLRDRSAAFDLDLQPHFSQSFVRELESVSLLGSDAVGRIDEGIILETTAESDRVFQKHHDVSATAHSIYSGLRSPPRESSGQYVSLINNYAHTYYHWVIDILPKLEGVKLYKEKTGNPVTLLLPPDPPTWMLDTLSMAGYDPQEWEVWGGGERTFSHLIVVSLRRCGHVPTPGSIQWLRDEFMMDNPTTDYSTRLFVSRRDADWRHIVNVDEVAATLRKYGFEEFVPSQHSFSEQISAFQNAEYIVGPHGSNLANIVFCQDPTIHELFGENPRTPDFWILSQILEFKYASEVGDSRNGDIFVDVCRLESNVKSCI